MTKTVTSVVRKLVGPGGRGYGRGGKWLYVGDNHTTKEDKLRTLGQLMSVFGGVKLITEDSVTYVFKIHDIGSCKMTIRNDTEQGGRTVIDYISTDWETHILPSMKIQVERVGGRLEPFQPTTN